MNWKPVLVVLGAVLLAGCSGAPTPTPTPAEKSFTAPRAIPAGMGSGLDDGVFPRTVKHFHGATEIPASPARIAVISTGQLDGLLTLGLRPVGTTRARGADLIPAYLLKAFPEQAAALKRLVDLGQRVEPALEAVAAVKPDLILANSTADDAVLSQLSAIAPTVVTGGTGVNWKKDFLLLADAVGRTQQAAEVLADFHHDAAALGAGLSPAPTVSFTRSTPDGIRIFGVASFTGSIAEDAGLARPPSQQFDDTSRDLSAEELPQVDANWVFYGVQGGAPSAAALTGSPLWPRLSAVAAGQARGVDDDVWYLNAGPNAARQVLTELAAVLG